MTDGRERETTAQRQVHDPSTASASTLCRGLSDRSGGHVVLPGPDEPTVSLPDSAEARLVFEVIGYATADRGPG